MVPNCCHGCSFVDIAGNAADAAAIAVTAS